MRKKKLQLEPKSLLRFDKDLKICYNCMFWNHQTGRCPFNQDNFNYNHFCNQIKLFRYNLLYKHYI